MSVSPKSLIRRHKRTILAHFFEHVGHLEIGHYSSLQTLEIDGIPTPLKFRFQNTPKGLRLVLHNTAKQSPRGIQLEKKQILLFDRGLNRYLKLDRGMVERTIHSQLTEHIGHNGREQVDLNLSAEQKELLCMGKDVTLTISKTTGTPKGVKTTGTHQKTFSADLTFFLGSNTLLRTNPKARTPKLNLNNTQR